MGQVKRTIDRTQPNPLLVILHTNTRFHIIKHKVWDETMARETYILRSIVVPFNMHVHNRHSTSLSTNHTNIGRIFWYTNEHIISDTIQNVTYNKSYLFFYKLLALGITYNRKRRFQIRCVYVQITTYSVSSWSQWHPVIKV